MPNPIVIDFIANDKVTSGVKKVAAGIAAVAAAATTAALVVKQLDQEMQSMIKQAKKQPDMFTPESIRNLEQYEQSTQKLTKSWVQLKANTIVPMMTRVARSA